MITAPARRAARSTLPLLSLSAALGACAAVAGGPPLQFVDHTQIAPKTSADNTISYEGYIAPPVFLYDNQPARLNDLTQSDAKPTARGFRFFVTPVFIVRQLKDSSSAVRTPSFNPRLSADWFRLTALDQRLTAHNPEFGWLRIDGLRLTLAHHSDGQAGCFLEGQTPTKPGSFEADDCSAPPDTGQLRTNAANGDFSTTYLSLMLHETWLAHGQRTPWSFGAAVSGDWEFPKGSGMWGALPDIERQFYGGWRARVQTDVANATLPSCDDSRGWCFLRGRARLSAMYEWAPRHLGPLASRLPEPIPHFRSYWDVSYTFDGLHGVGAFVRRVDGQDYYNIGFVHNRTATLLGVTMDLAGYEFNPTANR